MTRFRKGDLVSIDAVIDEPWHDNNEIKVRIEGLWGSNGSFWAKMDHLTFERAEVRPTDTVEWKIGEQTFSGEVLAVADDHAWIDRGAGQYATVWLPKCTRIDADRQAIAAPPLETPDPDRVPPLPPTAVPVLDNEDRSGECVS